MRKQKVKFIKSRTKRSQRMEHGTLKMVFGALIIKTKDSEIETEEQCDPQREDSEAKDAGCWLQKARTISRAVPAASFTFVFEAASQPFAHPSIKILLQ